MLKAACVLRGGACHWSVNGCARTDLLILRHNSLLSCPLASKHQMAIDEFEATGQ